MNDDLPVFGTDGGPRYQPIHTIHEPEIDQRSYMSNIVAAYNLVGRNGQKVTLNVNEIASRTRLTVPFTYNPKKLPALRTSIGTDGPLCQPTTLIYATGSVVQSGDQSPEHALLTAHTLAATVFGMIGIPLCVSDFRVVNLVSCLNIGFRVPLKTIKHAVPRWRRECNTKKDHNNTNRGYPSVRVWSTCKDTPKMVFLMYESGEVVIAGAKTHDEARRGISEVWQIRTDILALNTRERAGALVVSNSESTRRNIERANTSVRLMRQASGRFQTSDPQVLTSKKRVGARALINKSRARARGTSRVARARAFSKN